MISYIKSIQSTVNNLVSDGTLTEALSMFILHLNSDQYIPFRLKVFKSRVT